MKKKCILVVMILLSIGMAACTTGSKEGSSGSGVVVGANADRDANTETETGTPENVECTLFALTVESYENDIIAVRDQDSDIVIWFFTKDAEVIEGDSPIAVGDIVEITYRGLQGDEEHPGTAIKIVAESVLAP